MSAGAHVALAIAVLIGTSCVVGATEVFAQDSSGAGPSSIEISAEGKEVYETICQACHMADAKGGAGAGAEIPAVAGNAKLADKDFIVDIILHGRGGMPWLNELLTHQQIAAVSTYVRGHFNDYQDPVTEADVKRLAARIASSRPACPTC